VLYIYLISLHQIIIICIYTSPPPCKTVTKVTLPTSKLILTVSFLFIILVINQGGCRRKPDPQYKQVTCVVNNSVVNNCKAANATGISTNNVNYTVKITVESQSPLNSSQWYVVDTKNINGSSVPPNTSVSQSITVVTNYPTRVTAIIDGLDCSLCQATTCPNFNSQTNPGFTNSAGKPYWRGDVQMAANEFNNITTFTIAPSVFPRKLNPVVTNGVPEFCTCTIKTS